MKNRPPSPDCPGPSPVVSAKPARHCRTNEGWGREGAALIDVDKQASANWHYAMIVLVTFVLVPRRLGATRLDGHEAFVASAEVKGQTWKAQSKESNR